MNLGAIVANKLESVVANGFDISKKSKEVFNIYQEPGLSFTEGLDMALLSLIAMEEGPEFEMTEEEFKKLITKMKSI